jgi:hypothetical protein
VPELLYAFLLKDAEIIAEKTLTGKSSEVEYLTKSKDLLSCSQLVEQ